MSRQAYFIISLAMVAIAKIYSIDPFIIAVGYTGDLIKIDESTQSIVGTQTIPGSDSYSVAITPDGKEAYVVSYSNGVYIVDTSTLAIINPSSPISLPYNGNGIAISPDGKTAYVASYYDKYFMVIDIASQGVTSYELASGTQTYSVTFSADGKYAYIGDGSNSYIYVVDTSNPLNMTQVPTGSSPYYLAAALNNKAVYAANSGDGTLTVVPTSPPFTNTTTITSVDFSSPYAIAVTPDSKYAYVVNSDSPSTLLIMELATNQITGSFHLPIFTNYVAITIDGKYAYLAYEASPGSVALFDIGAQALTSTLFDLDQAAWIATWPTTLPKPNNDPESKILLRNLQNHSNVIIQK